MKLLLFVVAMIAVMCQQSAATNQSESVSESDVNDLCANVNCKDGKVCRVVEKTRTCGSKNGPRAKCVPCVPAGVDDLCNIYGYERTVLGGPNRALTPLSCHIHGVPNKYQCPGGSVCKGNVDTPGVGNCCYGNVDGNDPNLPYGSISNDDKQCSKCRPDCREDKTCQPDVECGKLIYKCAFEPKSGICPNYRYAQASCSEEDLEKKCTEDHDCGEGNLKCCRTACGGSICRPGYFFTGKK